MLTFFNINDKIIEILILLDYVLITYCISKFSNSFLILDNFYPKVKKYVYLVGVNIILFVFLFLIFRKNELYIILNILMFILLFTYWFIGILLFNKSVHNRIFALGYVFFNCNAQFKPTIPLPIIVKSMFVNHDFISQ